MRKTTISILFAVLAGALTVCAKSDKQDQNLSSAPISTEAFALDSTPIDRSNTHQYTSYASMLEKVTPSVVTVSTSSVVRVMRNRGDPMLDMMRRLYGMPVPDGSSSAPVEEERKVPNGLGSGVIISKDGYILTNNHVISDQSGDAADEITVTLLDGREFTATLVGRDPQTDVALLKIDAQELPAVPMANSDNLKVGDIVFAVGNPMGLSQTVTMGIVSAVGRSRLGLLGERGYEDFIQTDASINPGNSGGALVDASGRLVGINTAILSRSGGSIGIGFAIPSSMASSIALSLVESGKVDRGFLGVTIRSMDPMLAESFGIEGGKGTLVEGVQEGSPAEAAGIKRGDVIVKIDGRPVTNDAELRIYVSQKKPGTVINIGYIRDGEAGESDVTLGSLDSTSIAANAGENIFEGVRVQNADEEAVKQFGLGGTGGVVVAEVKADSPFSRVFIPGMQILEINDRPVTSIADAAKLLKKGAVNRLWVTFRGQTRYLAIRVP